MEKSFYSIVFALFCVLFFTVNAYAQMDEREPELYAIVGEESIPMT